MTKRPKWFGGKGTGQPQGNAENDPTGTVRRAPDGRWIAVMWPSRPSEYCWAVTDYHGSAGYEKPERIAHWPVVGAVPCSPAAGMELKPHPPIKRPAKPDFTGRSAPRVVDVHLSEAACGAVRDETGIRCSEPAGHTDHHKGKSVDEHGEPMFSRWSNTKTTPTSTRQDLADLRAKLAAPRTEPKWNVGGPIIPQPAAAVYVHQETNHG